MLLSLPSESLFAQILIDTSQIARLATIWSEFKDTGICKSHTNVINFINFLLNYRISSVKIWYFSHAEFHPPPIDFLNPSLDSQCKNLHLITIRKD